MKTDYDVIVVGAGLVGLTTALACARSGASVALLDRREVDKGQDSRVSALSSTSLCLFANLDVDIAGHLQPINDMLVTEGSPDSPWRLHFKNSDDSQAGSLGAIIENPLLKAALIERVCETETIQIIAPAEIQTFENNTTDVRVDVGEAKLEAYLLVAADGRESSIRKKAGITVQRFDYDAASLVTTISHQHPHDGLAWQRIIKGGALAVLPLTGNRSQIVWSGPSKAVNAAAAIPEAEFIALLSEKMEDYLGEMHCRAARQSYPLRLQVADSLCEGRIALVGDAAHIIHPLAGQGLNLGLRDAAALAEGVKGARKTGQDIGVASLLEYELWRDVDIRTLGALTHGIHEISGTKMAPIGHARRLGLAMINRSSILKSELKKRAAGNARDLPELLQNGPE